MSLLTLQEGWLNSVLRSRTILSKTSHSRRRWRSMAATSEGITTPLPDQTTTRRKTPFYFETGYALYAKRPSRPFPPPFSSPPSGSFSDPLSTHNRSRDRRSYVNGEMIRGITNGDDAVLVEETFIGANDGVGAWAHRPRGHAALWSRLVLHFWALEAERASAQPHYKPDPVGYLQKAYEQTIAATTSPNEWLGTTTACAALLESSKSEDSVVPKLHVTNLGDSQIMVIRPKDQEVIYKTTEQWHWFDCPRQLGTNSPDSPRSNAVVATVDLEEDDIVLAISDGVVDNLWEHEILQNVLDSIQTLRMASDEVKAANDDHHNEMLVVAQKLMQAARVIAEDPFAESPFMERAIEEGLAMEGGKLDDISVVAAVCKRRKS